MRTDPSRRGTRLPMALAAASGLVASPAFAAGTLELAPDIRFFYLIALFVLLIYPVNRFLLTPLLRVLDERRERIEGARNRAAQVSKEADSVLAQYESAVRAAKDEAEGERRNLVEAARREQIEASGAVRAEAEQRLAGARGEVGRLLGEARGELRSQAEGLAREAASRVLGRPLS